eukprot:8755_1
MKMNGSISVAAFFIYALFTYCECLPDCNYVMNVTVSISWKSISWSPHRSLAPIGVCESGSWPHPITSSTMYECAADGNSVVYKLYKSSSECLGTDFSIYSGDNIHYSSFKCGASMCPYVQITRYGAKNWTNPSCDAYWMNETFISTTLINHCRDQGNGNMSVVTCTGNSLTGKEYDNEKCSGTPKLTRTIEIGCNESPDFGGIVYGDITCYSGCDTYKSVLGLIAVCLLAIDIW